MSAIHSRAKRGSTEGALQDTEPKEPEQTVWNALGRGLCKTPRSPADEKIDEPRRKRPRRLLSAKEAEKYHTLTEYFKVSSVPKQELVKDEKEEEDEVVICSDPQAAQSDGEHARPLEEDEDVLITGMTGPLWNVDLPHLRHDCGLHPFKKKACAENRNACDKCICFLCDDLVANCKEWAKGAAKGSVAHCNAYDSAHYSRRREATRRRNKKQQADPENSAQE